MKHSDKKWVRGDVHTQGVDGFWSLLKRGIIGSFHQISVKHLHRYIDEFQFRFNNREEEEEIFAMVVMNLVLRAGIQYKTLTGAPSSVVPASEPSNPDEIF